MTVMGHIAIAYTFTGSRNHFQFSQDGESTDSGPLKNYTLCTDSESDMKAWISAITEEIKPMIGETYQSRAGIKANAANVDQKAFDVVGVPCSFWHVYNFTLLLCHDHFVFNATNPVVYRIQSDLLILLPY